MRMIFIASGSPKPYPLYLAAILPLKKGYINVEYPQEEFDTYIINSDFILSLSAVSITNTSLLSNILHRW
jgi:hypothetical protein